MCEVLPYSSGHWAPNTLWKTNLSVFCHSFSLQQLPETKKNQLCINFQCSTSLQKAQHWTPRGKKANRKAVFSLEMWSYCHFREGVYLVGWAARGSLGAAGFLLDCSALRLEFLSQLSLACGTHHSMSWQLSTLARHGCLWRDAVLKGWNMGIVECKEKSIV